MLTGHQAQVGHQLPGRLEATDVAQFRQQGEEKPADHATLATVEKMPELLRQAAILLTDYRPLGGLATADLNQQRGGRGRPGSS